MPKLRATESMVSSRLSISLLVLSASLFASLLLLVPNLVDLKAFFCDLDLSEEELDMNEEEWLNFFLVLRRRRLRFCFI